VVERKDRLFLEVIMSVGTSNSEQNIWDATSFRA